MRKVFVVLFSLLSTAVHAVDYYVSSSGSDSANGLSSSTPWKTIAKVNQEFYRLNPGDRILFKRGEIFGGTLTPAKSGTSGSPIVIGAFGTGQAPIISGFVTVTGWRNEGNGVFSKALSCESTPNMLLLNGINTPQGRWPDTGWMSGGNYTGRTTLTHAALPSNPSFTGGTIVVRTRRWVIDKAIISSHSGTTLNFASLGNYDPADGTGYFIQNCKGSLNRLGEWAYQGGTLYMYFGTDNPENHIIKLSTRSTLLSVNSRTYLTIENIDFEGANTNAIYLTNSGHITIRGCKINYSGERGIYGTATATTYNVIQNCSVNNSNSNGIEFDAVSSHITITNNTINNSGSIVGMGLRGDESYTGIICKGAYGTISYNTIYNCGYDGIRFGGASTTINHNFIDRYCFFKDDGAGIYSFADENKGKSITYNTIIHGIGAPDGWNHGSWYENNLAHSIYMDGADNNEIAYNNCAYNVGAGIFNNETRYNNIHHNTMFDNEMALFQTSMTGDTYARNNTIVNNIYVALTATSSALPQHTFFLATKSGASEIPQFGTSDYNYFLGPISNDNYLTVWINAWGWAPGDKETYNLSEWQVKYGKDLHSISPNIKVSDIKTIKFEYNHSNSNKVISLGGNYIDVKGNKYAGTITLLPYTSAVLMVDPNASTPPPPPPVPVYVSSVIENATPARLEMTYSLSLAGTVPATSTFAVRVNSTARTVSSVAVSGTKVILTLSSPVVYGNTVTVAYTKPSSSPLQTSAGGQAVTISAQTVNNKVAAVAVAPPVVPPPPVTPPAAVNTPPVAVVNYTKTSYSGFVNELNASGSYDTNRDVLTYTWSASSGVDVSGTRGSIIKYLTPIVSESKTIVFTLNISDGKTTQTKSFPVEVLPYQPDLEVAQITDIEASGYQSPDYPHNIIDGDISTIWSADGYNQWIILELSEPFSIQHIKLAFKSGLNRESYFEVFGSDDRVTWEPVVTKTASCAFSDDPQVFELPPAKSDKKYKYVKLVGLSNSADSWNYISELTIFGYGHRLPTSYEQQPVKIFPNPASTFINVRIEETTMAPDFIRIVSLSGKIVFEDMISPDLKEFIIPINLIRGIYIVQIGKGVLTLCTQKLIVNN